jgi:SAM-dependent methyltransferase
MGYVFDFQDAVSDERWFQDSQNQAVVALQNRLMLDMIHPVFGQRLLDIGCGTGASLTPFLDLGIQLTAIDPSPYMLDVARDKFGHRVDLHWGHAEELPFDDNAFHWAVMCMSLEFCDDPGKGPGRSLPGRQRRGFCGDCQQIRFKVRKASHAGRICPVDPKKGSVFRDSRGAPHVF